MRKVTIVFFGLLLGFPILANSSDTPEAPEDIGSPGLEAAFDNNLFSKRFSLKSESQAVFGAENKATVSTTVEAQSDELPLVDSAVDEADSDYQSQGLKIKRLSASWQSEFGPLTVGSDWANFQDTLRMENGFDDPLRKSNRSIASQIRWFSPNGFAIAIEDNDDSELSSVINTNNESDDEGLDSPSIILSWQGGAGDNAGEYRVTAMGTKLDAQSGGQKFDGENVVGWGLNLEGGWQIGDLFAALSVTYGKGINSYILQRFGNEILVTPNQTDDFGDAYNISPSLYYSLNENSDFHVVLGRYSSNDTDPALGVSTLDTIHMGYSWSPWPSTRFGLELIGQKTDGPDGEQDDARFKFGAQKLF